MNWPQAKKGLAPSYNTKAKGANRPPFQFHCITPKDQFGIRSGTIVTIDGKNHKIAIPTTWISTKGMIPR